jgi:methylmalonyl-CoA mutase N-terminal domain/subunit
MDTLKVNPEVESRQVQGLMKLKDERDNGKVSQSLKDLKEEAGKDTNLVPYVLDCVSNLATLGEISDVLREVFGRYEGGRTV